MTGREVNDAIRAYLRRVRCTQKSFAAACDVASSTIDGWRTKDPNNEAPVLRALAFIAKHPNGFEGAQRARGLRDDSGGGAAAVALARRRSLAPARPCARSIAVAAREDAWSPQRRARARGRSMVT